MDEHCYDLELKSHMESHRYDQIFVEVEHLHDTIEGVNSLAETEDRKKHEMRQGMNSHLDPRSGEFRRTLMDQKSVVNKNKDGTNPVISASIGMSKRDCRLRIMSADRFFEDHSVS